MPRIHLAILRPDRDDPARTGGRGRRGGPADVTVPIAVLPDLVPATGPALEAVLPGVRRATYGRVDDGNLHHNLSKRPGAPDAVLLEKADALSAAVYDEVTWSSASRCAPSSRPWTRGA